MACKTLDTDILVAFLRGNEKALRIISLFLESYERLNTTVINLFELYYGAYKIGSTKHVASVRRLEDSLETLTIDNRIAEEAGREYARLSKLGQIIDIRDLLIGVTARENRCEIITGNVVHFNRIDGLKVVNWRKL